MKKMWNYFASILVMGLLAGCSNDTLTGDDSDGDLNGSKDAVYMNVTVQLPAGGAGARSTTNPGGGSSDGEEVGKDYENEVKEVLLVLAEADDNTFIASGEVVTSMQSKNIVSSTQKISKTKLQSYYDAYANNGTLSTSAQEVNVYIFCNPSQELRDVFKNMTEANKKEWVNSIATVDERTDGFWGGANHKQGFLMSNATLAKKTLPATMDEWKDFSTESKAFNLSGINNKFSDAKVIDNTGNIVVERSVARFDFRDGSTLGENTYDVVKAEAGEGETQTIQTIVQIQLQKMALVNMSKNFYYLRRVSSNGLKTGASICGVETNVNYVVDTDADAKNGSISNFDFASHFNFCFGSGTGEDWTIDATARNGWYTSSISEVLEGEEDNVATPAVSDNRRYKIWRYVTENTIPNVDNQMYGISTGIVFKGKMLSTSNTKGKLKDALERVTGNGDVDAILYEYLGNLYVTWEEVRAAAIEEGANTAFYAAVFGTPSNTPALGKDAVGEEPGTSVAYSDDRTSPDYLWDQWKHNDGNVLDFKHAATGAKFTLYQSSVDDDEGAGYYCYYYYWNRHNDNGEAGTMGPMEFAVVRNNVYKLSVTNIHRLGHPRIPENDPDKPKPDIPDEQDDIYLTLSVEVLPWVVRVNDIEF